MGCKHCGGWRNGHYAGRRYGGPHSVGTAARGGVSPSRRPHATGMRPGWTSRLVRDERKMNSSDELEKVIATRPAAVTTVATVTRAETVGMEPGEECGRQVGHSFLLILLFVKRTKKLSSCWLSRSFSRSSSAASGGGAACPARPCRHRREYRATRFYNI